MSNLRNRIIRLAHQKPELREHLLPLVKEASKGQAKSVIQDALKNLDWGNLDLHNFDVESYVEESPQWNAFLEGQYRTRFNKAYKLLSKAYSSDNVGAFQQFFPRSKFFQNVGSTKSSKYALAIVKTMKEILRKKTSWEFGVVMRDYVDYWQGGKSTEDALMHSGFRRDLDFLGAEENYTALISQETKRYLDSQR